MKLALIDAKLFHRGIKRDSNSYPILKSEKSFTTWIRGMKAEMAGTRSGEHMQRMDMLSPLTPKELKSRPFKTRFLYAVFNQVLKTSCRYSASYGT